MNSLWVVLFFVIFVLIEKLPDLLPTDPVSSVITKFIRPSTINLITNVIDNTAHCTTVIGAFMISYTVIY